MKTLGEVEAAICEGVSRIEQEYLLLRAAAAAPPGP